MLGQYGIADMGTKDNWLDNYSAPKYTVNLIKKGK